MVLFWNIDKYFVRACSCILRRSTYRNHKWIIFFTFRSTWFLCHLFGHVESMMISLTMLILMQPICIHKHFFMIWIVTQSNFWHPTPFLAGLKFHILMDLTTILQSDFRTFNSYLKAYVTYVYNLISLKIISMFYLLI